MPSKKSWKRSRRFPFLKRTQSALSAAMETGGGMLDSVASQMTKPLYTDTTTRSRSLFPRMSHKKKQPHPPAIGVVVARTIKFTVVLLLVVAIIVSAVYLALYTRDYINEKQHRNPAEVVRASLLLAISIIVLIFVNSYWNAIGPFSLPLSISLR